MLRESRMVVFSESGKYAGVVLVYVSEANARGGWTVATKSRRVHASLMVQQRRKLEERTHFRHVQAT